MSILTRRAAALSFFVLPVLALAQASVQQTESNELETIMVVATRTERALEELAATVSVKTAEDIDSNDPRPETAGYGILDLMAYARFGERMQLSAGLFNLADKAYVRWADTGGIGDDAFARSTQPGLNASVALSVDF